VSGTTTTELDTGDNYAVSGCAADVVVDGGYVYWVTSTAPNVYAIRKTPVAGGPSSTVITTPGEVHIEALAGGGGNLYWMENNVI